MRKPFAHNRALDQQRQQNLDNQTTPRYAPSGRVSSYPLAMTGSVTNPIFGAGAFLKSVRYARMNGFINVWFNISFTAISSYGSGTYALEVPSTTAVPVSGVFPATIGYFTATRSNGAQVIDGPVLAIAPGLNHVNFGYRAAAGIGAYTLVGSTAPWTWATFAADSSMALTGFFSYEAQDIYSP